MTASVILLGRLAVSVLALVIAGLGRPAVVVAVILLWTVAAVLAVLYVVFLAYDRRLQDVGRPGAGGRAAPAGSLPRRTQALRQAHLRGKG